MSLWCFNQAEEDNVLQDSLGERLNSLHIYVTMADATLSETNKLLVRRRYELSYNLKAADSEVKRLCSPSLVFNAAGTQLPMSQDAALLSGIDAYLDRCARAI